MGKLGDADRREVEQGPSSSGELKRIDNDELSSLDELDRTKRLVEGGG